MKKNEKITNDVLNKGIRSKDKRNPPIKFSRESDDEIKIVINKEIIAELSNLASLDSLYDTNAKKGEASTKGNTCTGTCNNSTKAVCTKGETR